VVFGLCNIDMSYAYFDIETDGLEADCAFKCGVVYTAGENHTFIQAVDMASFLAGLDESITIVSFNGLSFDFARLAAQCTEAGKTVAATAMAAIAVSARHVDIMFAFLAAHGYYASMQSFAAELNLTKTWSGAEAAQSDDIDAIKKYCEDDVTVLRQVHESAIRTNRLTRNSQAGRTMRWLLPPGVGPKSVAAVLADLKVAKPDQSWMTNPPVIPDDQIGWVAAYNVTM
jgi:hypothetical protein